MQSVSTERIIHTINQNTNVVLSNMQEATNMILSQFDVIVNSISDTRDANVPRLFMLLPGKEPHSIFKPRTWGKNTFIVHVLCEGLMSDNSEAHFTDHPGYKVCCSSKCDCIMRFTFIKIVQYVCYRYLIQNRLLPRPAHIYQSWPLS